MITRRDFIRLAGLGLAASTAPRLAHAAKPKKKPNFLFILVDDLGWRDLGCFGSSFYETPNIDRLAAQGMRFTNAYAACPVCSPTRASIMTGKYPARMATTDWFGAPQPETAHKHWSWTPERPLLPAPYEEELPLEEVTIAEALREAGYSTFFAGKWHLGGKGFFPEDQGFDINKGGHHRGSPPGGYFAPYRNPKLSDGEKGEHLPARLAQETVQFIKKNRKKPFLAYLSFYSVHTPLQSRKDLKAKYEKKAERLDPDIPHWGEEGERKVRLLQDHPVYAGMVEAMDQAVGTVLTSLDKLRLSGDTIIILMSDNGGLSTSEGHPTSNLPLRAGKGWLYEGGIRVPMTIKWPGVTEAGAVCDEAVTSTDFYPTMLQMAGLPLRPQQHLDGQSLTQTLKGEATLPDRPLYWHYPHYGNQGSSPSAAIRQGDWKLIEYFDGRPTELYNLRDDLSEKNDLAKTNPAKTQELTQKLHTWQQKVNARFPTPDPKHQPTA